MIEGKFTGSRILVTDEEDAEEVHDEHYYGKHNDGNLELSMVEAFHLKDRGLIEIVKDGEHLSEDEALELFYPVTKNSITSYRPTQISGREDS